MTYKLIFENFRRFLLTEQKVSYSGVVLDDESVQKLKEAAKKFGVPEGFVFKTKADFADPPFGVVIRIP